MARKVSNPSNINGWEPKTTYQTFLINPTAPNDFANINARVRKISEDIQDIEDFLIQIRNEMGADCGCAGQINGVVRELEDKRYQLIKKNAELLTASGQVIAYVYDNKKDKSDDATQLARDIKNITIYKG